MIKENQRLLNQLNVASDGLLVYLLLPVAYWLRFNVLPGGVVNVTLREYMLLDLPITLLFLFSFAAFGLYRSFRNHSLMDEFSRLLRASTLDILLLLSLLFVQHDEHYSRWTLAIFYLLVVLVLSSKRLMLRRLLRSYRQQGYNQKHVIILGSGRMANTYLQAIQDERELGYSAMGYVAGEAAAPLPGLNRLGGFEQLEELLNDLQPDEVISAIEMEDYQRTPQIIADCEKTGTKLSIIPFYADYIPSNPDFDDLNGIPLLNIRRIPLDNWGNAFCKRAMDIVGSLLLIILTSPVMLVCALGVLLSSPGPVIFKQRRIGRNKQPFDMYKFRSMRVNSQQETGWSSQHDDRKTKFGAFMRKCSLDEFPQFFNVLKGDMSLVGPRPEVPFYVDQFKDEIPLYMVKHQVRPGITGWAQVNGLRGDTSIKARVEHDIYYIEHWRLLFDLKILLITVFKGKFMNEEKLD